jgi:predicted transcriptional regulator
MARGVDIMNNKVEELEENNEETKTGLPVDHENVNSFVSDDILVQAKDIGKASVDFGKKTGKFLFNITRLGINKLGEMKKKVDTERDKLESLSDNSLKQLTVTGNMYQKMAALQILKERNIVEEDNNT